MSRKMLVFLLTFVFLVFSLFLTGKVYAFCTQDSDCAPTVGYDQCTAESWYCDGLGYCHVTWECGCYCGWGDWRACIDGYTTRYCSCLPILYQISSCIEGGPPPEYCTPAGPIPDQEPDCGATGLMGRYYVGDPSYLASIRYDCGPRDSAPIESCSYWNATWDGYFIAPTEGDYQFMFKYHPVLVVQIDVNNDDVFDGCPANRLGDEYFFRSTACQDRNRPVDIRKFGNSGIDSASDCGWPGCFLSCWPECSPYCFSEDSNIWRYGQNEPITRHIPSLISNYNTLDPNIGTAECPINRDDFNYNQEGERWLFFTRHLTAGLHKINIRYTNRRGDSMVPGVVNMWYRTPPSDNLDSPGSGGWISALEGCPFTPCAPSTGTVQGRKVIMPGYLTNDTPIGLVEIEPAISQTVTLSGVGDDLSTSPYYFNNVLSGNKTVSITVPANYSVVSTLCYGRIGCHTDACAAGLPLCPEGDNRGCAADCTGGAVNQSGLSRTVDVPAGGFVDLWWHYPSIISGQVKRDDSDQAVLVGGVCQLAGAEGVKPGGGSKVTVSGGYTGTVEETGNYSISNVPVGSGYIASLTIGDPAQWSCTCPDTCTYSTSSPKSGLDYFVSYIKDPWWQVDSGNVHADGGDVSSPVPNTATLKYLITGKPGLASYTGSLYIDDATAINQNLSNWQAQTEYKGRKTKYGYFKRILQDDPLLFGDWSGEKPTSNGVFLGSGAMETDEIEGTWTINSGDIYVILVPNDVTIKNNINVVPGGFLAIISSGNITIGDAVTKVQGVFIADGTISTGNSENQLIGEGIFTGWLGFDLTGRDFNSTQNNTTPVLKFIYRPDLVRNAYKYLKKPRIGWQEVAP